MNYPIIARKACDNFLSAVFERVGCPPESASEWAALLTETSLLGIDSHGVQNLSRYLKFIEGGGLDPGARVDVVNDDGAGVRLDGRNGPGHLVAWEATRRAMEKAGGFGCGCANVAHVNHVGATGVYARRAAIEGFLVLCFGLSRALMAPHGGRKPAVGPNPLAIAAPLTGDGFFLADFCTSTVAMGKVLQAMNSGASIPSDWALDRDGRPTTDPAEALQGSLLPIGGHKGFGLTLAIEILTAGLSGGPFAHGVNSWINQTDKPMDSSFTVIVLNIRIFRDLPGFTRQVEDWLRRLAENTPIDPGNPVRFPGQSASETFRMRSKEGIPIPLNTAADWREIADRFNVKQPSFIHNNRT